MNVKQKVIEANDRIRDKVRRTPLEYSSYLSELTGARVFLKLENYQLTGSFKLRGALNKLLSLPENILARGIVAASTGNHAAAIAYAAEITRTKSVIYMPGNVSEAKVKNLRRFSNVELVIDGPDCIASEYQANKAATDNDQVYVSPYNDEEVVAGQGTIGLELYEDLPELDHVLVPVGGGGLIAGIAGYLKAVKPAVVVTGCQPENSAVMYHSIQAGKVLEMASLPTVSDGTAGGMEEDSITFPLCQQYVDNFHLVSETEIVQALRIIIEKHYMLVEGAAGLSLASLLKNKQLYMGKNVVLILCGNKMTTSLLKQVLQLS